MFYLNTDKQLENFEELFNDEYFVDKSEMINLLNKRIATKSKYVCITRPRRFGKSSVANMIGAYYTKNLDSTNIFGEYFGFTEEEVKDLCLKNNEINFKDIKEWYNGYLSPKGVQIYNPRSVIKALQNNYCESYWTNTGAMDEVLTYLKYNILEVRDDIRKRGRYNNKGRI